MQIFVTLYSFNIKFYRFRLPLTPWLILKQLPLTKYARRLPISIQLTPPVLTIDRKRDYRRCGSSAVLVEVEKMAEDFTFPLNK